MKVNKKCPEHKKSKKFLKFIHDEYQRNFPFIFVKEIINLTNS